MADENVQMIGEVKDNPYTRIMAEKHELDAKIIKLHVFINRNPQFNALSSDMRILLRKQLTVMCEYSDILNQRILLWD